MSTEAELAELAAACDPLRHARSVGEWVGDGRTATAEGWPRPDDLRELAAILGVTVPERPLDPDAPALGRAWFTAREIGLVEINDDQAHTGELMSTWPESTATD